MERLEPNKLYTTFLGVTPKHPIIPRKYTLTHSDLTTELFLVVGRRFSYEAIGHMRDEVLAEWGWYENGYALFIRVHIDDQKKSKTASAIRYKIFQREMPLALKAILFGDRKFFKVHPMLDNAPILIKFASVYPEYNDIQYWGAPSNYWII